MSRNIFGHILAIAMTVGGTVAMAAPSSIDGVLGPEWNGVPTAVVNYDANAPESNFGSPGTTTSGAPYTVQVRDDGAYYYVGLKITGDPSLAKGNFANLYFDTDPANGNGSDVGFEVNNNRYFIAGDPANVYYDATPYLTFASSSTPGTIELAISNSFFTSGPLAGLPFPGGYPAATGNVVTRLSQAFGYSVAGGPEYGDNRLGSASVVATAPVPEPETYAMLLLGLGALAFAGRRGAGRTN